jgi:hypothetical protein
MHNIEHLTRLAPIRQSLDKQLVDVLWDPQPQVFSPDAAAPIEDRWRLYLADAQANGKTLFDGPITRLLEVRTDRWPRITLRLGPAQYKTFLVTRVRDRPWFEAHAPHDMALALGNSALLTHGHQALLGLRSDRVSAYAGRLHMFGGVLEALDTPHFPASTEGLLAHLRLELHEEARLTPAELEDTGPRVLGIAHDDFLGQPEIFWQWETRIDLHQVAARLDASEHAGSRILGRQDMTDHLWQQLTPVTRQAWLVWCQSR